MDDKIRLGHPFYFPTQAVLVDDDPDFLDGISLMLNKQLSYKLFQSANDSLNYLNQAHLHVNIVQRSYSSYKTGPTDSDSISHIDIGKLHLEVLNANRFLTCSTLIVDYSMPEMNGLELLMHLENPFIKKVLLTGQADMELAVKAFNQQLIDQFIDKHDPRLKQKLNATIASFQDQYFRRSYKFITDPLMANNSDGFLVSNEFQQYFEALREKMQCVEYYLIDCPHAGFLMLDDKGTQQCLLIYTRAALDEHYWQLKQAGAAATLLQDIKNGAVIPTFDLLKFPIDSNHVALRNREQCYIAAERINASNQTYFVALTSAEALTELQGKLIIPYNHFMETNGFSAKIVH